MISIVRLALLALAAAAVTAPARAASDGPVVFLGASVIRFWPLRDPEFFKAHPDYRVRGTDGQSTIGTRGRTARDILPMKPSVVLIQPTGNDRNFNIPANESRDNLVAIAEMVRAQGGKVVILGGTSASPVDRLMADYARDHGLIYVDFSVLHGPDGPIKAELSTDGTHPNLEGYRLVEPRVVAAIEQARAAP